MIPRHGRPLSGRPVIRLFGPLSIEDGERRLGAGDLGGSRPKQVLEILLAARGHRVTTDRLAELVWGEERPQDVAGSLQTFVSALRRHLHPDRETARALVVTEPEAYRFATDLVALDLDLFDELLERSAREPTRKARRSLEAALELVRGEVLEDEPYSGWALDLRGTYQGRILGARLEAADAALAELDLSSALAHSEAAAALDPFSERAHRIGMLALYALGRQHDALARYRAFRVRLDEELGLEPTPESRALEGAILRQEDAHSLLPRSIAHDSAGGATPSPGLLGRSAELEVLTGAVHEGIEGAFALVQIEGESGLGKSRLLDELATRLGGARIGRASSTELQRHLPYVPLAAALRDALAGEGLDGSPPALAQILPELGRDGQRPEFETIEVLEALVALVDAHAPLVLMIDDLHRADAETVAALAYLHRRASGIGGAVVVTRDVGAWGDFVGRLSPDVAVRLEPLTEQDLAHLPLDGLHASTGGNPRFVAAALAIGSPARASRTLAEALVAQCRAEGPRAFRALTAAAILEQPFRPEPLAELLEADPIALTEELERLCERRILRVDGLCFRFRYELVREVLRESVSPARRRLLARRLEEPSAAA
jgi:DNA-binding SARP family transcriptional activator